MDALLWDDRPELRSPVLLGAFKGWNDAGEAASGAMEWLRHRWEAQRFARIDPDPYFDFQAVRPQVVLVEGVTRELHWPANECFSARLPSARRDAVLLSGVEPSYRWRDFCSDIVAVAQETGCEMVVTLGALLADVPHTRPLRITGTAGDEALARRLGLERSRYEGPTGIVGVLHDACLRAGLPSVSLWAPVPHYVGHPPNPVGTLALLQAVGRLLDCPTDTGDLQAAAEVWRARVDEAVADDAETSGYVRELERRYDEEMSESDLPSGEELAAQIEEFLRDEGVEGP